ncbi:MAG: signal recognition particle subunit SRP19/SEC65 family protein [Candidatus Njordarchaeales archaeon]
MSEREEWIIYPEYFDSRLSRRLGRKVSLQHAIKSPQLEELYEALKYLKIRGIRIEKDKSHPANWIERKGRIIIYKIPGKSKHSLLIEIAKALKHVRIKMLRKKKVEEAEKKKKKKRKDIEKYLEKFMQKK